jgi:hypothetical protein
MKPVTEFQQVDIPAMWANAFGHVIHHSTETGLRLCYFIVKGSLTLEPESYACSGYFQVL